MVIVFGGCGGRRYGVDCFEVFMVVVVDMVWTLTLCR